MNERMTELLTEAATIVQNNQTRTIPENLYGDEIMEKFAELIVQECLDIMTSEQYNTTMLLSYPSQSGAIDDAKWKIRERFGIKK